MFTDVDTCLLAFPIETKKALLSDFALGRSEGTNHGETEGL